MIPAKTNMWDDYIAAERVRIRSNHWWRWNVSLMLCCSFQPRFGIHGHAMAMRCVDEREDYPIRCLFFGQLFSQPYMAGLEGRFRDLHAGSPIFAITLQVPSCGSNYPKSTVRTRLTPCEQLR